MATAQYLSKYLLEKCDYVAVFAASQCGLSVSTSMKPESVAVTFEDYNKMLTILIIICYYIKYELGKSDI